MRRNGVSLLFGHEHLHLAYMNLVSLLSASLSSPNYSLLVAAAWQVAWQALREDVDAGDAPQAGHPASVGAVLSSQRLLLVSPQLRVLVAAPPGPAITSFLWLGPALLYATSDHQVCSMRSTHPTLHPPPRHALCATARMLSSGEFSA